MSGTLDGGAEPVFRLVYRSAVRILHDRRREALADIFEVARWKNDGLGITGALLVWQDAFVQVIEGEESVVRNLYGAIHADPRHDHVVLLEAGPAPERVFGGWSMARVGNDGGDDIPVETDREAARTEPRPGATRQNTMLDRMREYARTAA